MKELQVFIDFHLLQDQIEQVKRKHRENGIDLDKLTQQRLHNKLGSSYDDPEDALSIKRVLKRFKLINPALLNQTIKKCESQGLIQNL